MQSLGMPSELALESVLNNSLATQVVFQQHVNGEGLSYV